MKDLISQLPLVVTTDAAIDLDVKGAFKGKTIRFAWMANRTGGNQKFGNKTELRPLTKRSWGLVDVFRDEVPELPTFSEARKVGTHTSFTRFYEKRGYTKFVQSDLVEDMLNGLVKTPMDMHLALNVGFHLSGVGVPKTIDEAEKLAEMTPKQLSEIMGHKVSHPVWQILVSDYRSDVAKHWLAMDDEDYHEPKAKR